VEFDDSAVIGYGAVSVVNWTFYTSEVEGTIFLHSIRNQLPIVAASYPRRMESHPHHCGNLKTHVELVH
jgi:hypothetical protein